MKKEKQKENSPHTAAEISVLVVNINILEQQRQLLMA